MTIANIADQILPVLTPAETVLFERLLLQNKKHAEYYRKIEEGFTELQMPQYEEFTEQEMEINRSIKDKIILMNVADQDFIEFFFEIVLSVSPIINAVDKLIYPEHYN